MPFQTTKTSEATFVAASTTGPLTAADNTAIDRVEAVRAAASRG